MEIALVLAVVVGVPVFFVLLIRSWMVNHSFAAELARRPPLQYTVAGLDKDREVGRHAVWATGPLKRRQLLRRLDAAAGKIAEHEAEQRRRR